MTCLYNGFKLTASAALLQRLVPDRRTCSNYTPPPFRLRLHDLFDFSHPRVKQPEPDENLESIPCVRNCDSPPCSSRCSSSASGFSPGIIPAGPRTGCSIPCMIPSPALMARSSRKNSSRAWISWPSALDWPPCSSAVHSSFAKTPDSQELASKKIIGFSPKTCSINPHENNHALPRVDRP
jgi:hypothetical protein